MRDIKQIFKRDSKSTYRVRVTDDIKRAGCESPELSSITYVTKIPFDGLFYLMRVSSLKYGINAKYLSSDILIYKNKRNRDKAYKFVSRYLKENMNGRRDSRIDNAEWHIK